MGGYFFIAIMVYRTIIRIKVMYSTASPPPKKEGAKSITPSGIKRGKTANRMATPVCILPDHSSGRNSRTEKRQDSLPLFAQRGAASKRIFQIRAAGTPKLFSIHFSLFIFFTRSCARVKNQGIPPPFRGLPENRRPQGPG